eukprot:TRINITY_DN1560_c0_g1_i1.p1 TRINITY_DN1560_c0_g1~~TRINITY_DN1560_c0_g1_i1.p1  ORF type:complete len:335 (-),score=72.69 TRINITY_DN1560_c0_g1_i1:100-1104(-)
MFIPLTEDMDAYTKPGDTIWGCSLQSAMLQLNLLQHWAELLDRFPPVHKKLIWDTCKLMPIFKNFQHTSFRKTVQSWVDDPLPNVCCITTLFGAIGFLSYHNIIKQEFCYPNIRMLVFKREQEPQPPQPLKPVAKKYKRGGGVALQVGADGASPRPAKKQKTTSNSRRKRGSTSTTTAASAVSSIYSPVGAAPPASPAPVAVPAVPASPGTPGGKAPDLAVLASVVSAESNPHQPQQQQPSQVQQPALPPLAVAVYERPPPPLIAVPMHMEPQLQQEQQQTRPPEVAHVDPEQPPPAGVDPTQGMTVAEWMHPPGAPFGDYASQQNQVEGGGVA